MKNSSITPLVNMERDSSVPTTTLSFSITLCAYFCAMIPFYLSGSPDVGPRLYQGIFKLMLVPPEVLDTLQIIVKSGHGNLMTALVLASLMTVYPTSLLCLKKWDSLISPRKSTSTMSTPSPTSSPDREEQFSDYLDTLGIKYSQKPNVFRFKKNSKNLTPLTRKSSSGMATTR